MAIYVDKLRVHANADESAPPCFRFKPSCHMYADSEKELIDFARRLNMQPSWMQKSAGGLVHFDLTESKRKLAVRWKAVEHTDREMIAHMKANRQACRG